jgi:hypothetical protein
MKKNSHLEARTVAVLLALSIGLGLAVHGVFFLLALGITAVAVAEHWETPHMHR